MDSLPAKCRYASATRSNEDPPVGRESAIIGLISAMFSCDPTFIRSDTAITAKEARPVSTTPAIRTHPGWFVSDEAAINDFDSANTSSEARFAIHETAMQGYEGAFLGYEPAIESYKGSFVSDERRIEAHRLRFMSSESAIERDIVWPIGCFTANLGSDATART